MTLEELTEALGLNTDENKDKAAVLKKEYNAQQKELNKSKKELEKLQKDAEDTKASLEQFEAVKKSFGLDFTDVEDIDKYFDDKKDELTKAAGGGTTPEEVKELNRTITKLKRENDKLTKSNTELTESLTNEQNMRIDNVKRSAIRKALEKNNVIDPDTFVKAFLDSATVDNDGKTVTITGDDGSELGIDDYVSDWAKDHTAFVKKEAKSGFGSNSGLKNGGQNGGVSSFMSRLLEQKANANGRQGVDGKSLVDEFGIR